MKYMLTLMVLFVLSSCAKDTIKLDPHVRQQIQSSEIIVPSVQKQAEARVEESQISAATGGGLIFGMIDGLITSKRAKNTAKELESVHDALENFSLRQAMEERLANKLREIPWLGSRKITVFEDAPAENFVATFVESSKQDVVLSVTFKHYFMPNFERLTGELQVVMYPASSKIRSLVKASKPSEEPIYKRKFIVFESLDKPSGNMVRNVDLWFEGDNEKIKKTILKLLDTTLLLLKDDLTKEEVQG